MNSSSQLIRTNTAITSNFKLVSSQAKKLLYLEAFESNPDLSASRFKHFSVPELSFLSERVSTFFKDIPAETGFAVKNNILPESGVNLYSAQIDDIYYSGISTVGDVWYNEEFEAFAPLLVNKDNLPDGYIILRIDGPGNIESTALNFKTELLSKAKVVHYADMSKETALGRFLARNYTDNPYYLQNAIEIELDNMAFSRWNGIDYYYGGYTSKSFSTSESLYNELTPFTCEKFFTNGFKMLNVAWTGILNLTFLFDDTPAKIVDDVPVIREWSQNRYLGFYIDKTTDIIKYSPYTGVKLKLNDVYSENNIFYSGTYANRINLSITSIVGNSTTNFATVTSISHGLTDGTKIQITNNGVFDGSYTITYLSTDTFKISSPYSGTVLGGNITDPYCDPTYFGWKQEIQVFIKDGDTFLPVDRLELKNSGGVSIGFKYVVVSDTIHSGDMYDAFDLTQNAVRLRYDNTVVRLEYVDGSILDLNEKYNTYNDLIIIEIDNEKYRLQYDSNGWYINTDQLLYTDGLNLTVLNANGKNKSIAINKIPSYFTIKSCTFCDIKDLDTNRIITNSSRFEHEGINLDQNQDLKLYMVDEDGNALVETDYSLQDTTTSTNFYVPITSEYVASGDLFNIENGLLSDIWRKNPIALKWGFTGSKGRSDGYYMFNNSARTLGYSNREPLSDSVVPDRTQGNLDWFYTMGSPATLTGVASDDIEDSVILPMPTVGWEWDNDVYHSLCVTPPNNSILRPSNISFGPNYQKYFWRYNYFSLETYKDKDCPFDYFEWFFTQKTKNLDNVVLEKWSTFNDSLNDVVPCETLFRGLMLQIWNTTTKNPLYKEDYNLLTSNEYNGYKFAAILTKRPTENTGLYGTSGIDIYVNKIYNNILLAIWVYVPINSMINAEFINRDNLYDVNLMTYMNGGSGTLSLDVSKLTLKNIIHKINEPDYNMNGLDINKYVIERKTEYNISSIDWSATRTTVLISSDSTLPYNIDDYIDISYLPAACGINGTYEIIDVNEDGMVITILKPSGSSSPSTTDNAIITTSTPFVPFVLTAHESDTLIVNSQSIQRKDINVTTLVPTNSIIKMGTNKTFVVDNNIIPSVWNNQPIATEFVTKTTSRWESEVDPSILRTIRRFKGGYEPVTNLIQLYKSIELIPNTFTKENTILGNGMTVYTYNGIDMLCIDISDEGYTFDEGTIVFITDATSLTGADVYNTDRFYKILDYITDGTGNGYIVVDKRAPIGYSSNTTFECQLSFYDLVDKNTRFDTELTGFGNINIMESRYFGDTVIKESKMIYPMIDEVGMTERQRYIFKSSWDNTYYNKSKINKYNTL